ncbi:hypothetical protein L1987_52694 [Smallanthus sonchifolius]|uniref:Uncharacterized protein n=1 Tax=Smallanthus sonchifolius TaxID=185202 RepID=A0ACB9ETI3_9ASTR|nr:hypothetical protein L1987_52694 [Smallanthus sonchifolius]
MFHTSHAQNSPQDYLNAHNAARAQVGVGNMEWNPSLAAYAQSYANQRIGDCNLVHSGGLMVRTLPGRVVVNLQPVWALYSGGVA